MELFDPQSPRFSGDQGRTPEAGDVTPERIFDFANIAHCWSLAESEQRELLGGVPVEVFDRWRLGLFDGFTDATGQRIARIFEIFSLLQVAFLEAGTADGWVRKPNYDFHGRTPLSIMTEDNDGLIKIRNHLQEQLAAG